MHRSCSRVKCHFFLYACSVDESQRPNQSNMSFAPDFQFTTRDADVTFKANEKKNIYTQIYLILICYLCKFRWVKTPEYCRKKEKRKRKSVAWRVFWFSKIWIYIFLHWFFFLGLTSLHIGWYTPIWFSLFSAHNRIKAFLDVNPTFSAKHSGRTPRIKRLTHCLSLSLFSSTLFLTLALFSILCISVCTIYFAMSK